MWPVARGENTNHPNVLAHSVLSPSSPLPPSPPSRPGPATLGAPFSFLTSSHLFKSHLPLCSTTFNYYHPIFLPSFLYNPTAPTDPATKMQSTTALPPALHLPAKVPLARRRGPPVALRIDTPMQNEPIAVALGEPSASSLSSAGSDSPDFVPFAVPLAKPRSLRNMKKLSLTLSAGSSTHSLALAPSEGATSASTASSAMSSDSTSIPQRSRAPSAASLTTTTATAALAHRREEDGGSPTVPYADGPVEIIPGIWLGSEDNAREFDELAARGIKAILNVAKEVTSPFEAVVDAEGQSPCPSVRPDIRYLKMDWSHGQSNLIQEGFPIAMAFVDEVRKYGGGVLVQYAYFYCNLSSGHLLTASILAANVESHVQRLWSLLLLCEQPRLLRHPSLPRYGD